MSETCILIVEPDVLVLNPLAEYLRECGYKVLEAFNANEARQILATASISVQIVLADVDGAGNEGFALAREIRTNYPTIDVILAGTIAKAAEKAGDLCEEGPDLAKPYDHRLLLDHIRRMRGRHQGG
jgi:DNA-binding response OmpR family regulator